MIYTNDVREPVSEARPGLTETRFVRLNRVQNVALGIDAESIQLVRVLLDPLPDRRRSRFGVELHTPGALTDSVGLVGTGRV